MRLLLLAGKPAGRTCTASHRVSSLAYSLPLYLHVIFIHMEHCIETVSVISPVKLQHKKKCMSSLVCLECDALLSKQIHTQGTIWESGSYSLIGTLKA